MIIFTFQMRHICRCWPGLSVVTYIYLSRFIYLKFYITSMLVTYTIFLAILLERGSACPYYFAHTLNELTENCVASSFITHTDLAPRLSQRGKLVQLQGLRNCFASAIVDYPLNGVDPLAFSCFLVDGAASPPVCENKENRGQVTFSVQCKVSAR